MSYARPTKIYLAVPILALAACEEETLRRVAEPAIHVDELAQQDAAKVDILWVVDNSESMRDEQDKIARNFDRFITGLSLCKEGLEDDVCDAAAQRCSRSGAPCNPPDYHIGVISTDTLADADRGKLRQAGTCVPTMGASPTGARTYCASDNAHCGGPNPVCDMGQSLSVITPTTESASTAFARIVRVGTTGTGLERGIQAAAQALGRDADKASGAFQGPPAENAGFVRDDATLFVIFVSDEEDSSFGRVSYFYRAFEGLKGAGNEGLVSLSAIVGTPDLDGAGPEPGGCEEAATQQTARAGTRYVSLAMYSRGLTAEFRVCDGQRLGCPEDAACTFPVAGMPGICVPTGACQIDQDCGNFKCGDRGCITCENATCKTDEARFLSLLERNGVFASICAEDYSGVLAALGFDAAGLRRKFELTKPPDCSKKVPCGSEDNQVPVCVKVNGQVVPNARADGWVYEPASNAIFFDGSFVPKAKAAIEVSYRLSAAAEPVGCTAALE